MHVVLSTLVVLIVDELGLLFQVPCCQWPVHVVLSTLVVLIVDELGLLFQVPCCQWPVHVVLSTLVVLIAVERLMINVRKISDHVQHTALRMPVFTPIATYLSIIC